MGRVVGNHCEHGENTKIQKNLKPLLTSSQKLSIGSSWVILSHLTGYMEFLFLKLVVTFLACVNAATLPRHWGIYLFIHIHTMLECIVVLCFLEYI
jgi:hypothetical protein